MGALAVLSMESAQVRALGRGNVLGLMFRYSVPAIFATVINAAYNIVDRIFLGRCCGEDALAAVTVCFTPTLLFLSVGMTIGMGSATIVSIRLGRKDKEGAEKALGQAIFLFFAFCALLALAVLTWMEPMLSFFGATDKIVGLAASYYYIIISGLIFEKISFGINNIIRAEGRPVYAMTTIIIGAAVNVFLDWLFVYKMDMGVKGAAYATVIAQACASLWVCRFYFCSISYLKIRPAYVRLHFDILKNILTAGSPAFVTQSVAAAAVGFLIVQARSYGSESAIAVVGIVQSVITVMFLPVVGLGMGMQPIIGYNWGARNLSRVRSAVLKAIYAATFICALSFAVGEFLPRPIFEVFLGNNSGLVDMGVRALRIIVVLYPLIGFNIVVASFFQSTKRPAFSILVVIFRQVMFFIPLAYALPIFWGIDGLWFSYPISDFFAFFLTLAVFVRELPKLADGGTSADVIDVDNLELGRK